ncbi:hypothetical protein FHG89_05675 [Micromonospora orduensis]|uniref:DUF3592 domain-containing protein n=1 Tax=Micromonospora orduensis TaxID=1420891 RepID=A0A5C4QXR8_9ACTN|nr:DUF3592 domain-containing protein [Micromonospora orduensis]TNH30804.1 hypothetical protein FHG89_05675 [Micromonospora orduensis]
MDRRRPSRTFLRVFSAFCLVFAVTLTALSTWSLVADRRGSEAESTVLDVEHQGGRTIVTVQFSTSRGEVCEATFRVAVGANRAVTTGERIRVHHSESEPCLGVREVGDHSRWYMALIAVLLLIVFGVLAYVAWRRPRPPLPLRYAGMP